MGVCVCAFVMVLVSLRQKDEWTLEGLVWRHFDSLEDLALT